MKGLMVSLITVFFAGAASSVLAAVSGQQASTDAAGIQPRLGQQSAAAPSFERPGRERPGPDDSDDDFTWPTPKSLLSKNSTTTSQVGDQQTAPFTDRRTAPPAPESSADKNIRFDVKVDKNAIAQLRRGLKVYSPVEVVDESTRTALDPIVVSDIALFLDDNAGKNLNGVRLEPVPMERGSTTLRFEIPEQQLDRIEQDAFLFEVPNNLRGQFDRVEFVAVSGSNDDSVLQRSNDTDRFGNPIAGGGQSASRWDTNLPQPGPGYQPGDHNFTGPSIDPGELQSRNQVASLDPNRNNGLQPLNTNSRFPERATEVEPRRSPFGLPREQSESDQTTFNQNRFNQNPDAVNQSAPSQNELLQRQRDAYAAEQMRILRQQAADAKAKLDSLAQNANDWKDEAARLAAQRNQLSDQLKYVGERQVANQPTSAPPARYSQQQQRNPNYIGQAADALGSIAKPFGTQRNDFNTRDTKFVSETQADLDRQEIARLKRIASNQEEELKQLDQQLYTAQQEWLNRPSTAQDKPTFQNVNYGERTGDDRARTANAADAYDAGIAKGKALAVDEGLRPNYAQGQQGDGAGGPPPKGARPNVNDTGDLSESKFNNTSNGSSDLIWLLPLLLASLGLNFFLWVHSRSLYLRYTDLADELREMVGASTI